MSNNIHDANFYINKLLSHYNILKITELAPKLNISYDALNKWKTRNSIKAIRNKCIELNIYNEIFNEDANILNNETNSKNIQINDILLIQAENIAKSYGLSIDEYVQYLIIEDLKKEKIKNN